MIFSGYPYTPRQRPLSGAQQESTAMSVIGIIGGTGSLGGALAGRLARAGHRVLIGSRSAENATKYAAELAQRVGKPVEGCTNLDAAHRADIVVNTVPFAAQEERLAEIRDAVQGKVVVETAVPLMPPRVMRVQLPAEGSAAQRALAILGEGARVVSAFHNVAADKLAEDGPVACDVLVFSDDKAARAQVVGLVADAGLRAIEGGGLPNSAAAEAMTSVLIFINRTYQVPGAGITITGELVEPARS
jgi:NADPH-dependent F420 reductase